MAIYRREELALDQLTAFAISDDHARQEQVLENMHGNADREDILAALNQTHVSVSDPRAIFVGKEAYVQAGGAGRILISAMGVVAASLSVTGVVIWYRKRRSRVLASARSTIMRASSLSRNSCLRCVAKKAYDVTHTADGEDI